MSHLSAEIVETPTALAPWRRHVAILVSGVGISSIGDFIYLVALNVFVLNATHSPAAVAGIWVVGKVASLLVSPWAGSITDRLSLRKQLALFDTLRALLVGSLPLLHQLTAIYAILFVLGACSTFFSNAFFPFQTSIVPANARKRVNSILSMLRSGSVLLGPAAAGVLMQHGHVLLALTLDGATFMFSALTMLLLPEIRRERPQPSTPSAGRETQHSTRRAARIGHSLRADWQAAVTLLRQHALFTALYVLVMVGMVLGTAADAQEVVFAENALHLGEFGYGMMVSAAGVGFVAGSLIVAVAARHIRTHWLIGLGVFLGSVGYLIYALSHSFWWAVTGLVILGVFNSAANVGLTTFQQHTVPVDQMGLLNNVLGPPQEILGILFILLGGGLSTAFGVRVVMVGMTIPMAMAGCIVLVLALLPHNRATLAGSDAV